MRFFQFTNKIYAVKFRIRTGLFRPIQFSLHKAECEAEPVKGIIAQILISATRSCLPGQEIPYHGISRLICHKNPSLVNEILSCILRLPTLSFPRYFQLKLRSSFQVRTCSTCLSNPSLFNLPNDVR